MGVKDIRVMNVSLLVKWRCRLLEGDIALWKDVLKAKYGYCMGSLLEGGTSGWPRYTSFWWKELVKLGDFGGFNWFNSEVERKVGNELSSSFWNDTWRGDRCFRIKYPRLYSISTQREAMVGEVGMVSVLGTEWSFNWRRHLFMWEEEVLLSIKKDLDGIRLSLQDDVWRLKLEDSGVFSIKSSYKKLEGLVFREVLWRDVEKGVFDKLWKSSAPSKVVAFAWRVLLNRAPTKANLALRNVLGQEESNVCVTCNMMEVLERVWLIWHATVWVLWKTRNDKIFKGVNYAGDAIVEEVKVLSWRWTLSRMHTPACLFFEWCWNPQLCLARKASRT